MATRRDQIQAHRFAARRLDAAVVGGEPGTVQAPNQRLRTGLVLGAAAALLGLGGSAVAGMLQPAPNTTWRTGQSIIVEQSTYSRYVYSGGVLYPVLNLASARLLLSTYSVSTVAASQLTGIPQGRPIGIPGAPDELPAATALDGSSWTACSEPGAAGGGTTVSASLGVRIAGAPVADSQAVYVTSGGARYLLWRGERHLLISPVQTMAGLGMAAAGDPVPVSAAWLAAVPRGADIQPLTVGVRRAGPSALGATQIGDLYTVQDLSGEHWYAVTDKGLTPVTAAQAALLQAGGSPPPRPLGEQALASAESAGLVTAALTAGADLPAAVPSLATPGAGAACVTATPHQGSSTTVGVTLVPASAVDSAGTWLPSGAAAGTADRTLVKPGSGALVVPEPGGAAYLLTDRGVKYPTGSSQDLGRLGYANATPTTVPAALLSLFPTGPALTAQAAQAAEPLPGSGSSGS